MANEFVYPCIVLSFPVLCRSSLRRLLNSNRTSKGIADLQCTFSRIHFPLYIAASTTLFIVFRSKIAQYRRKVLVVFQMKNGYWHADFQCCNVPRKSSKSTNSVGQSTTSPGFVVVVMDLYVVASPRTVFFFLYPCH